MAMIYLEGVGDIPHWTVLKKNAEDINPETIIMDSHKTNLHGSQKKP